jgi:hypothetical protein
MPSPSSWEPDMARWWSAWPGPVCARGGVWAGVARRRLGRPDADGAAGFREGPAEGPRRLRARPGVFPFAAASSTPWTQFPGVTGWRSPRRRVGTSTSTTSARASGSRRLKRPGWRIGASTVSDTFAQALFAVIDAGTHQQVAIGSVNISPASESARVTNAVNELPHVELTLESIFSVLRGLTSGVQ